MDANTSQRWPNIIWQPILAIIFICFVLFIMNQIAVSTLLWAVGAGALSSTSYIVFSRPHAAPAKPWCIVGAYLIGIFSGEIVRFCIDQFYVMSGHFINDPHYHLLGILASVSVGITLIITVLTKLEHPPAAGMALVIVVDVKDYKVLAVIFAAACLLAFIRWALNHWLRDLY